MAGNAKPNIDNLGKEGRIKFLDYNDQNRFDKIETLLDGNINKHTDWGVLIYSSSPVITFEINQKSNIWAYGQIYSDSGGRTPYPVELYIKEDGNFTLFKSNIPTKSDEWYVLFTNLEKGVYQVKYTSSYTMFTEWYVETMFANKYLIKQNNQYYTLKSEFYKDGKFTPLTLESGINPNVNDFKNFGFDDIGLLTKDMSIGEETFKPKDKLKLIGDGKFDVLMKEVE